MSDLCSWSVSPKRRWIITYILQLFKKRELKFDTWEMMSAPVSVKISSLPLRTSYTAAFFLCPFTSNMPSNLDGHSSSMGTRWSCIAWGEGVCVFHTHTAWRGDSPSRLTAICQGATSGTLTYQNRGSILLECFSN